MGIIKAVKQAIGGGFADTWQEVIEPDNIGDQTVYARGVLVNRGQNKKGSDDIVSNGSIIHVYDNQFMILVDGGKIVDYTAEPGYYKVSNSSMPSLFNGQFGDSLKETFDRVRFGGQTPQSQKVYYINLQEIKGIKFGTRNPINYYDTFYNAELFLRAHGTYSIKIVNPLQFYAEAIPNLVGTELSSYFFDHLVCSTSYGVHSERGEHERQHSSDEQTNDYDRLKQADIFDLSNFREGCEQSQSCQSSRTDRESLTDSSRCVTNGVQLVRDLSYVFRQFGHFCDTACIVGNRTVSVNRDCHSCRGKHTYCCKSNTI